MAHAATAHAPPVHNDTHGDPACMHQPPLFLRPPHPCRARLSSVGPPHAAMQSLLSPLTPPYAALVQHVIVHQAGGVDHLHDLGQTPVPLRDATEEG